MNSQTKNKIKKQVESYMCRMAKYPSLNEFLYYEATKKTNNKELRAEAISKAILNGIEMAMDETEAQILEDVKGTIELWWHNQSGVEGKDSTKRKEIDWVDKESLLKMIQVGNYK